MKKPGKEARELLLKAARNLRNMAGFNMHDIADMLTAMSKGERFWKSDDGMTHEIVGK